MATQQQMDEIRAASSPAVKLHIARQSGLEDNPWYAPGHDFGDGWRVWGTSTGEGWRIATPEGNLGRAYGKRQDAVDACARLCGREGEPCR